MENVRWCGRRLLDGHAGSAIICLFTVQFYGAVTMFVGESFIIRRFSAEKTKRKIGHKIGGFGGGVKFKNCFCDPLHRTMTIGIFYIKVGARVLAVGDWKNQKIAKTEGCEKSLMPRNETLYPIWI